MIHVVQKLDICLYMHFSLSEMGREAAANALKDAHVDYSEVEAVVASYNYGDPTCGKLHVV